MKFNIKNLVLNILISLVVMIVVLIWMFYQGNLLLTGLGVSMTNRPNFFDPVRYLNIGTFLTFLLFFVIVSILTRHKLPIINKDNK